MAIALSMCCAFPVTDIFLSVLENIEKERESVLLIISSE